MKVTPLILHFDFCQTRNSPVLDWSMQPESKIVRSDWWYKNIYVAMALKT